MISLNQQISSGAVGFEKGQEDMRFAHAGRRELRGKFFYSLSLVAY
jgi:hypothetical protein